jgi:hypothetical protein
MCSGFGLDYFHNIFRISELPRKSVVTAFFKAISQFLHSSETIQEIKLTSGITWNFTSHHFYVSITENPAFAFLNTNPTKI